MAHFLEPLDAPVADEKPLAAELPLSWPMGLELAPTYVRKTRLCKYNAAGFCKNGGRCSFAHGMGELQERPDFSRTRLCLRLEAGLRCQDPLCSFAHHEQELRPFDPSAVLGRPQLAEEIEAMSYAPPGDRVPVPRGLFHARKGKAALDPVPDTLTWLGDCPGETWQGRCLGGELALPPRPGMPVRRPRRQHVEYGQALRAYGTGHYRNDQMEEGTPYCDAATQLEEAGERGASTQRWPERPNRWQRLSV